MLPNRVRGLLAGLIACAGAAACGDPSGADISRISILLTDAAGEEVVAAHVGIERIELIGGGPETGGAIVLLDVPWVGDVMELQNSFATLVGEVEIPSGHYTMVRLIFSGMCVDVDEDEDGVGDASYSTPGFAECPFAQPFGDLQDPSFMESGLKVKLPGGNFEIDGGLHTILLDFDVAQSFGHGAGGDKWVAHPVVHATEVHLAATVTVNVTVEAAALVPDAISADDLFDALEATVGGESMAVVQDGAGALTGSVFFGLLPPGDYAVDLSATGFDLTSLAADVSVDGAAVGAGVSLPVNVTLGESGDAIIDVTVSGVDDIS